MSVYHFQVRTASHVLTSHEAELGSSADARREAARRVGDLLTTHDEAIWVDEDWRMDVTDERGLILFVIQISAMKTAATSNT